MSLRKKLLDTFGAQVSSDHERYPADVKCLGFLYLYVGRYPRNNASRNTPPPKVEFDESGETMQIVTLEIPDVIQKSHGENIGYVAEEAKKGLVIWEYLNGRLTIGECGEILETGYRGFLELLWRMGIPADALDEGELTRQITLLRGPTDEQ